MKRVLFVCLGNICRSPTAEGVMRQLSRQGGIEELHIDSAGTGNWHIGASPDRRAMLAARQRGIDISPLKARQVTREDLENFDLVIAMDRNNRHDLLQLAGDHQRHKVRLLLDYSPTYPEQDVPDPYYGGEHGFDIALDMIEDACRHLLKALAGK